MQAGFYYKDISEITSVYRLLKYIRFTYIKYHLCCMISKTEQLSFNIVILSQVGLQIMSNNKKLWRCNSTTDNCKRKNIIYNVYI